MGTEQFTTNPGLTAIAIAYANPAYSLIADSVMPLKPVSTVEYTYTKYPEEANYTVPDTRVGTRSAPRMIEIEGMEATSKVVGYGIDIPLDNATIKKAETQGNYDPKKQAVEQATNIVNLDREVRVAKAVANPNNYHVNDVVTLAGTAQFSDFVNSDPLTVLLDWLENMMVRANQVTMGQTVWSKLRRHPKLVKAIGSTTGEGAITKQQLADLLELRRVLVGESRVNVNRPGQNAAYGRVWGNFIAGHFLDETVTPDSGGMTWGLTARHGSKIAGTLPANIGVEGGVLVRSADKVDEVVLAQRCGALIQTPVA